MDTHLKMALPHATLAALPVGQTLVKLSTGTPVLAAGGAGAAAEPERLMPDSRTAAAAEARLRGRPTAEDRKRQKRLDANSEVEELLDSKPSKSAVREFLLARVSLLLEEKGIGLS